MKSIYVCEHCGKQFEDYSECSTHESAHVTPELIDNWCDVSAQQFDALAINEFDADDLRPHAIWIKFHAQNDAGGYCYDDNGSAVYDVARYVLDSNRKTAPKAEQILDAMRERRAERRAEDEARKAERARKEAEKAESDAE